MGNKDIWPTVHAERAALAADLEGIDAAGWDKPSLCHEWTVRQTLAHMTATAKLSPAKFFVGMLSNGFSITRMQAKGIQAASGASPAETLTNFKAVVNSNSHPPGPIESWLGEAIVHSSDIRRVLNINHAAPMDALRNVADFYKKSNLIIGTKKRITGVRLSATDTDWTHGSGPEVSGPMASLVMAMTGRKSALDDLTGDGVQLLRTRP